LLVGYVLLVFLVEQDLSLVLARIIDPPRELFARRDRTSRIIWKTKINEIDMFLWRFGNEIVFGCARQVNDPFIASVLTRDAGATGHHIRVDIDRINRIGNRDLVLV